MRRLAGLAALVMAAATAVSCGSSGPETTADGRTVLKLAIATPTWNAGFSTLAVAETRKYFEQEKVDVKISLFDSGTRAAQQVIAGQSDLALVTAEPVGIGQEKGTPLTYFAGYYPKWISNIQVPAGSGVRSVADLPGKRVGVTAVASSGATFVRTAMKMEGLDANSVKFIPIGGGAQQINAIKSGKVDVLGLWDTQYQIIENAGIGLTPLPIASTDKLFGGGFAVKADELKDLRDPLTRFGRAMAKAMVFAQANPEAAVQDLWKLHPEARGPASTPEATLLANEAKVLKVRLNGQGVEPGHDRWGEMDEQAVTATVSFMRQAGLVKKTFPATEIFTNDLIPEINKFSFDEIRAAAKSAK
ncbi:ABC transporter substrate-binding protein [Actinomadura darangshiensis]|uniref:Thiamine pyrimidine synthase n=2 Tax=Actinomadura darangshiensis TaxID=705336 RepID=A0A4R5B5B3_9ACTN|nr:ABC transporter substrate-binding protein [Actinomadura darangshiensis]